MNAFNMLSIDRIKSSSIEDGEKVIKINKLIHVLSAKYVDFNKKSEKKIEIRKSN